MFIDLVIVVILLLFCVRSYRAGMTGELMGAMGWIVAIVAAIGFSEPIGNMMSDKFEQFRELGPYVSFLIIVLILRLLFMAIVKLIPDSFKGPTAIILNIFASALGFFKGAFFVSVVLLLLSRTNVQPTIENYAQGGVLYPHLRDFSIDVVVFSTEKIPNVEAILQALS